MIDFLEAWFLGTESGLATSSIVPVEQVVNATHTSALSVIILPKIVTSSYVQLSHFYPKLYYNAQLFPVQICPVLLTHEVKDH